MYPPRVFGVLQYFGKVFPLVESLCCALQDEVYIMGVALLGACDVIQDGSHLRFYPKISIAKKRWKLKMFHSRHVEYDIIKHFAAFVNILRFFSPKKGEKHALLFRQNGLNDHLLLKTLHLVTTAINSRQTYVKVCVRDMRAATENGRRRRRRKIILEKV